ncbi:MAG: right-handed parallel beta-helix repeat-containing protein [Lentisphaeria bacterium]|nr:right-handed parallel beta-helix repeat-containing protein [Lentisphaeria bacterium]
MKQWVWIMSMSILATGCAGSALYVAPGGNDANPGTRRAPLATLAGARDRVRTLKAAATGPIVVEFSAGVYRFSEAAEFVEADSGTADAPVVYRAAKGAEVRLTGGVEILQWKPVTDAKILERLPEESRSKVRVADLSGQVVQDLGRLKMRGFSKGSPAAEAELFQDDVPMTLARWPNEEFRGVKATSKDKLEVTVDTDRIARWTDESDPWLFAYWHHDWAELYEPIRSIDTTRNVIRRDPKIKPIYGITPGRARWYALNLLSELDQPGEYYIDRSAGKLYFWPPGVGGKCVLSVSNSIIHCKSVSHVTFQGFIIEACRGTAVRVDNGANCKIVGCTVRNTGHRAVSMYGYRHEVYGCDVYYNGEGGIVVTGGVRKTLAPGECNVENNHVHHYSRRARTYKTGITISGCGNRMAHNLIHHGPHMAISAPGNDHVVEYNEIHNAVYESGDAGAYYVGRDWTQRGNVLRYNYWHQIVGATGHGGMTIYLDDQHSGHTIHGNIFERCSRAVFIGGGDDNIVTNNVFVDCWKAAHMDNRGMGWQKKFTDDLKSSIHVRLRAIPYKNKLWSRRYPNLVNVLEDDPGVPKRNVFRRNVSAGGCWDDINQATRHLQVVEDNVVHDSDKDWIRLAKDKYGRITGVTYKDPAALEAIGFERIPFEKMGLYKDPRRASWPVRHEVDKINLPEPTKPKKMAQFKPKPVYTVPRAMAASGAVMELSCDYDGGLVKPPAEARIWHDGTRLHVVMTTPLPKKRNLGAQWGACDAIELAFKAADGPNSDTLVLRGFTNGKTDFFKLANGSKGEASELAKSATYTATVEGDAWRCAWTVALKTLGVVPGDRMRANVTVRRSGTNNWVMWRPTHGDSTNCERVGTLELAP